MSKKIHSPEASTLNQEELDEIKLLLKDIKVDEIISIDDDWPSTKKTNQNIQNNPPIKTLSDFFKTFSIEINQEVRDLLEFEYPEITEVNHLLEKKSQFQSNSGLKDLIEKIEEIVNIKKDIPPNLQSLDLILNIMKNPIKVTTLSSFGDIDFESLEEKCLFIIDRNMAKNGGPNDAVYDYISHIQNSRGPTSADIIIIYSSENNNDYIDQEKKVAYLSKKLIEKEVPKKEVTEKAQLMAFQLWAINKTIDARQLKDELLQAILDSFLGHSLYHYLINQSKVYEEVVKFVIETAGKNIKDLSIGALIEGESFIDSLNRAKDSRIKKLDFDNAQNLELLKNVHLAEGYISSKNYTNVNLSKQRKQRASDLIKNKTFLQEAKHSLIDFSVNKLYKDIGTGDLFKIKFIEDGIKSKEVYAILITPECDCVIRDNPSNRSGKNFKVLCLDAIELNSYENQSKLDELVKANPSLWPFFYQDNYFRLKETKTILTVNNFILDLCSLNADGIAYWNNDFINNKSLAFKTYPSQQFFQTNLMVWKKDLEDHINHTHEDILKQLNISDENHNILKNISKVYFKNSMQDKFGIEFSEDTSNQSKFAIERIGRLESRRTLQIIQNSTNHLSRAGSYPNSVVL